MKIGIKKSLRSRKARIKLKDGTSIVRLVVNVTKDSQGKIEGEIVHTSPENWGKALGAVVKTGKAQQIKVQKKGLQWEEK